MPDTNMTGSTLTPGSGELSLLVESDGTEAAEFLDAWHGNSNDLVQIVKMLPGVPRPRTLTVRKNDCASTLREHGLDELIYSHDQIWNLYHSVCFVKSVPEGNKRGGKDNVLNVPGVFLDLDVGKGKSFTSHRQIMDWIETLPVAASILVDTGSGGVQAYWRFPELVDPDEMNRLGERWHNYAQSVAPDGVWIDAVYTNEHLMRLPGSIRWPKKPDERPSRARLLRVSNSVVDPVRIENLAASAWEARVQARKDSRDRIQRAQLESLELAGENQWMRMYITSQLPEHFNENHSWDEILKPLGWVWLDRDADGRSLWARPGGDTSKSATTDWPESPHTMNLFSTAPETGLAGLKDAGIPLTKYRVFVQLYWNGDEAGFAKKYLEELGQS